MEGPGWSWKLAWAMEEKRAYKDAKMQSSPTCLKAQASLVVAEGEEESTLPC